MSSQSPIINRETCNLKFQNLFIVMRPFSWNLEASCPGFHWHNHSAMLRSFYLSLQEVLICIPIHTRAISSWNYKFTYRLPQPIHRLNFTCRISLSEPPAISYKFHKRSYICYLSWRRPNHHGLNLFRVYRYSFI